MSSVAPHHALPSDKIIVARIVRPHGLKGAVRVKSFTENPSDFSQYSLTDVKGKQYRVVSVTQLSDSDFFNVFFEGVVSRTDAEKLHGTDLWVDKKDLPPVPEDTFYYADLIGLKVVLADDPVAAVGKVIAVHNFGAGDLLEVQNVQDATKDSWMVLFSSEQVVDVDMAQQTVVLKELP